MKTSDRIIHLDLLVTKPLWPVWHMLFQATTSGKPPYFLVVVLALSSNFRAPLVFYGPFIYQATGFKACLLVQENTCSSLLMHWYHRFFLWCFGLYIWNCFWCLFELNTHICIIILLTSHCHMCSRGIFLVHIVMLYCYLMLSFLYCLYLAPHFEFSKEEH